MADVQANIGINIDASGALAQLKNLQRQISVFNAQIAKGSANAASAASRMQQELVNSINATGQFSASMTTVKSTTDTFTNALEKNKLSMGQYFRYAGASSKKFSHLFTNEFNTIEKVARERVKTLQTQYVKLGRDANGALKSIAVRPLSLDMGNLATQTAMAAQKQQIFNQLLRQGSTNLLNWGKNTQWAGRQLMVGFTIPLTIFGAAAASSFMKLEEQAIRFKRVYGELFTPPEETDRMLQDIQNLALEFTKYGVAVEKTMALAADAAAMGRTGADLTAQVTEANRLAVLGLVEQGQALETTTSLSNAFGVATEDLASKIDFLNAVENQTVTSIEDMTIAIPKAGPVVKQLGGDVEDLAFFLTAMKEGGINASEGANALKSGLASLINPTQVAKDMLAGFGINITQIVESNAGNVSGIVVDFATALDKLDPLNRARAIEQLFGKFQFSRISTLFQNVIGEGTQAQRVLELTSATTKELAALSSSELGKLEASSLYKFQSALAEFQAALAPVGEAFLKLVTPIIEFGTKVLNAFNNLNDGAKAFVVGIIATLGAIGPVLIMSVGLLANGAANLLKIFLGLQTGFQRILGKTTEVGQQTEYMTQEQLQAAAVAASLNQSHATLAQTFTSESAAVDKLVASYRAMIATQRSSLGLPFVASATTRKVPGLNKGRGVPGYKDGVLMVPGTGNKDTELALLTPGEAVIPADKAKEYAPLINSMIAGNIPGYNDGKTVASHFAQETPPLLANVFKTLAESGRRLEKTIFIITKNADGLGYTIEKVTGYVDDFIEPGDTVIAGGRSYGATAVPESDARNRLLYEDKDIRPKLERAGVGGSWQTVEELSKQAEILAEEKRKNTEAYQRNRASVEEVLLENEKAQQLINQSANKEQASLSIQKEKAKTALVNSIQQENKNISADEAERLATEMLEDVQKQYSQRIQSGMSAEDSLKEATLDLQHLRLEQGRAIVIGKGDVSSDTVRGIGGGRGKVHDSVYSARKAAGLPTGASDIFTRNFEGQGSPSGGRSAPQILSANIAADPNYSIAATNILVKAEKDLALQIAKASKSQSPSKVTEQVANNLVGGVVKGLREGQDDMQQAGSQLADAAETGVRSRRRGDPSRVQTAGPSTPGQPLNYSILNGQMMAAAATTAQFKDRLANAGLRAGNFAEKTVGAANKIGALGIGVSSLVGGFSMINGPLGEFSQRIFPIVSAMTALGFAMNMLNAEQVKQKIIEAGRRVVIAQEVAARLNNTRSMIAEAAVRNTSGISGILGSVGRTAGKLGTNLSVMGRAVGSVLGSLLGVSATVGLVVAGLALLAGGIFAIYRIAENERQKIEDLGNSAKLTADQIAILGSAVPGMTLGASVFDAPVVAAEGAADTGPDVQQNIVAELRKSEEFLEGYKPIIDSLKNATADQGERMLASIAVELKARGGTEEQIAQVISALKQEAERTDVQLDFGSIDITTPENIASRIRAIGEGATGYGQQIAAAGQRAGFEAGEITQENIQEYNLGGRPAAGEAQIVGGEIASTIVALEQMRKAGTISVQEVQQQFRDLSNVIKNVEDPGAKMELLDSTIEKLGLTELIGDVEDFDMAMALVEQTLQGLEVQAKDIELFEAAGAKDASESTKAAAEARLNQILAETKALAERNSVEEAGDLAKDARNADIVAAEEQIQEEIKALQDQSTAYQALVAAGYADAEAKALSGNAAYARALAAAAETDAINGTTAATDALIANLNALREAGNLPGIKPPGGSGGGGGTPSSFLDGITKDLNQFVDSGVKIGQGFNASLKSIQNFSKVSVASLRGLSGQLRDAGASESMIEKILGMDPKEWEKQKKKLFKFDNLGNITGLTKAGEAIRDALNVAEIGKFINEQENITISVGHQITALTRLTDAGASYEAAYEAVKNTAFAAAIATATSSAQILAAANAAMEAQKMMKRMEAINEEENRKKGIRDAVRDMNREFSNQAKILDYINKNRSKLSEAQISAILTNDDLTKLVLEPSIDPRALSTALANAEKQAELDLSIRKLTIEGTQGIFEEGFGQAMDAFGRQEQSIELKFKSTVANDEEVLRNAEEEIAKIQYEVDDYEAELERIAWKEEDINEAYDKRLEALDEVASANERITRAQQAQLDVADALSKGDIAAAAQAAQAMRSQQAQDAVEVQREQLEKSREAELANLKSGTGLGRQELEDKITALQRQIFEIEESSTEPAAERIRLAEVLRDSEIRSLEVLGKTREEWENIKSGIDMAQQSGYKFKEIMEEALSVVEQLMRSFPTEKPAPIEVTPNPAPVDRATKEASAPKAIPPTPVPYKASPIKVDSRTGSWLGGGDSRDWDSLSPAEKAKALATPPVVEKVVVPPRAPSTGITIDHRVPPGRAPSSPSPAPTPARNFDSSYGGNVAKGTTLKSLMRAYGGIIGRSRSGPPLQYLEGGKVVGPGTERSDSIPAWLSNGEYVIQASSVRRIGIDTLDMLNSGKMKPGYKDGLPAFKGGGIVKKQSTPVNIRQIERAAAPTPKAAPPKPPRLSQSFAPVTSKVTAVNIEKTGQNLASWFGSTAVGKAIGNAIGGTGVGSTIARGAIAALSTPVEMVGGLALGAVKSINEKSLAPLITGTTVGAANAWKGVLDPSKMNDSMFTQAGKYVADNKMFGAVDAEGQARARNIGNLLNIVGDPLTYLGIGAATKVAKVATASKAANTSVSPSPGYRIIPGPSGNNVVSPKASEIKAQQKVVAEETARIIEEKVKIGVASGDINGLADRLAIAKYKKALVKSDRLSSGPIMTPSQEVLANTTHISNLSPTDLLNVAKAHVSNKSLDEIANPYLVRTDNQRSFIASTNPIDNILARLGYPTKARSQTERSVRDLVDLGRNPRSTFNQMLLPQLGTYPKFLIGNQRAAFVSGSGSAETLRDAAGLRGIFGNTRLGPLSAFLGKSSDQRTRGDLSASETLSHENVHIVQKLYERLGLETPAFPAPKGYNFGAHSNARLEAGARIIDSLFDKGVGGTGKIRPYFPPELSLDNLVDAALNINKKDNKKFLNKKFLRHFVKDYIAPNAPRGFQFNANWFEEYFAAISSSKTKPHTAKEMKEILELGQSLRKAGFTNQTQPDQRAGAFSRLIWNQISENGMVRPNAELMSSQMAFTKFISREAKKRSNRAKKTRSLSPSLAPRQSSEFLKGSSLTRMGWPPPKDVEYHMGLQHLVSDFAKDVSGNRFFVKGHLIEDWAEGEPGTIRDSFSNEFLAGRIGNYVGANTPQSYIVERSAGDRAIGSNRTSNIAQPFEIATDVIPSSHNLGSEYMRNLVLNADNPYKALSEIFEGFVDYSKITPALNAVMGNSDLHYGNLLWSNATKKFSQIDFNAARPTNLKMAPGIPGPHPDIRDAITIAKTSMAIIRDAMRHSVEAALENNLLTQSQQLALISKMNASGFNLNANRNATDPLFDTIPDITTTQDYTSLFKKIADFDEEGQIPLSLRGEWQGVGGSRVLDPWILNRIKERADALSEFGKISLTVGDYPLAAQRMRMPRSPGFMAGGFVRSRNTDNIPAMLTAGEYVVRRSAVDKFGVGNLEKINNGTYNNGSVYNYNLAVNVKSDADPEKIARTVMQQVKRVDSQRVRGNRF